MSPGEQIGKCLDVMVKGKFRNLPVVPMVGDEVTVYNSICNDPDRSRSTVANTER